MNKLPVKFFIEASAKQAGAFIEAPKDGDAGFDLRSAENLIIQSGMQALVSTGLKAAIPKAWVGIVKDRSSMAVKQIRSHAGVIDASYRGEIKVLLSNAGDNDYQIQAGDKIAQLLILPYNSECMLVESEEDLGDTDRGAKGFGSTGKR
ncbi:MAG: dUTP diphosphatase [Bdellovibrionales bacterium]|nr:dUTP diphosphatase [Bdellovibrionales bacterium]